METVLLIIGFMIALPSFCSLAAFIAFENFRGSTGKISAFLIDSTQKNNVNLKVRRGKSIFVKNLTDSRYQYKVGNKIYRFKNTNYFCTKNQTPKIISIVYIKRFPKIFYIDEIDSVGDLNYLIYGSVGIFVFLVLSVAAVLI